MARPIVVIYLPEFFTIGPMGRNSASMELMSALNGGFGQKDDAITYTDYWKEYYWFCFSKPDIDAPEFKVFHEKDFTDIQYAELKQLIEESINNLQNPAKTS